MGFRDLIRLFLSEDEKIVIPINDDEIDENSCEIEPVLPNLELDTCTMSNYDSENMTELKELVGKLPSTPVGPAPTFKLERNAI